jgi:hypothetical protein
MGEFTKIMDRYFAIGYFLPSAIFLAASLFLWKTAHRITFSLDRILESKSFWLWGLASLVTVWLFAVLLMVLNRHIIRFKEGYGPWNQAWNPLVRRQQKRFRRLQASRTSLENKITAARKRGQAPSASLMRKFIKTSLELVTNFPDDESFILGTSLGNVIRAFEVYPRVMYGFEAISGWPLLQAVIPGDFRESISGAKAHLDFWINTWFLFILFLGEYIIVSLLGNRLESVYIPLISILVIFLSSFCVRRSAHHWGNFIKASFDVYLPDLAQKLRISLPASRLKQRKIWTRFSQAILYRLPNYLP